MIWIGTASIALLAFADEIGSKIKQIECVKSLLLKIPVLIVGLLLMLFGGVLKDQEAEQAQKEVVQDAIDSSYQKSLRASNQALAEYNLSLVDSLHTVASTITETGNQEQEKLMSEVKRMQYPMPTEFFLQGEITFELDTVNNILKNFSKNNNNKIPTILSYGSTVHNDSPTDSIINYLIDRLDNILIAIEADTKDKNTFLSARGELKLSQLPKNLTVLILHEAPKFRLVLLNIPIKILMNKNFLFIEDISKFPLIINLQISNSNYTKSIPTPQLTFESFKIDFGKIISPSQKILKYSNGIMKIEKFKIL